MYIKNEEEYKEWVLILIQNFISSNTAIINS